MNIYLGESARHSVNTLILAHVDALASSLGIVLAAVYNWASLGSWVERRLDVYLHFASRMDGPDGFTKVLKGQRSPLPDSSSALHLDSVFRVQI